MTKNPNIGASASHCYSDPLGDQETSTESPLRSTGHLSQAIWALAGLCDSKRSYYRLVQKRQALCAVRKEMLYVLEGPGQGAVVSMHQRPMAYMFERKD